MTPSIPHSVAPALLPAVPAGSIVHKIVGDFDWLRELSYLDPKERQQLQHQVGLQNDYLRKIGGML